MQTIAFRLIKGIMLLPATADGQEGYFAFDTGAMQTAVNRAYFPELQGGTIEIAKFTEGVKKTNAERCLPIRKHRGAREKRYSFGYAVFLILALMK